MWCTTRQTWALSRAGYLPRFWSVTSVHKNRVPRYALVMGCIYSYVMALISWELKEIDHKISPSEGLLALCVISGGKIFKCKLLIFKKHVFMAEFHFLTFYLLWNSKMLIAHSKAHLVFLVRFMWFAFQSFWLFSKLDLVRFFSLQLLLFVSRWFWHWYFIFLSQKNICCQLKMP